MTFEIRTKRDSDTETLEQIFRMNRGSEVIWLNQNRPADTLAEQCEGEMILVAESESQILGFVSVWEPERFIHHLYVHKDHQGRGIGRALVSEVVRRYLGELSLKCVKSNREAMGFYLNTGWREVSTGVGPDGEYALLKHKGTESGRDGRIAPATPPTPPGMRLRTGRFQ
jgi:GNAT superfamily N-acetyltransferase